MKSFLKILLPVCCGLAVPACQSGDASGEADDEFPRAMYFHSYDGKRVVGMRDALSEKDRERVNKARWARGQHQLPDDIGQLQFDLNGDGVNEMIVETGNDDPAGLGGHLVLRFDRGKCEIILAFHGSFGLIRREGEWDDIVVYSWKEKESSGTARTGMRFDGERYRAVWREENLDPGSAFKVTDFVTDSAR